MLQVLRKPCTTVVLETNLSVRCLSPVSREITVAWGRSSCLRCTTNIRSFIATWVHWTRLSSLFKTWCLVPSSRSTFMPQTQKAAARRLFCLRRRWLFHKNRSIVSICKFSSFSLSFIYTFVFNARACSFYSLSLENNAFFAMPSSFSPWWVITGNTLCGHSGWSSRCHRGAGHTVLGPYKT